GKDRSGHVDRRGRKLRLPAGRSAPAFRGSGRGRFLWRRADRRWSGGRGVSALSLGRRRFTFEATARANTLPADFAQITRLVAAIASSLERLSPGHAITQTEPTSDGALGFLVNHRVA